MRSKTHSVLGSVILDISGVELLPEEIDVLLHPQVGGVIFFKRNFEELNQLKALVRKIREVRPELLLCVDQEGGRVQRFRDGFTRLPSLSSIGSLWKNSPEKAAQTSRDIAWLMAAELLMCGVDLSFAPVVDADLGVSQVIGDRSFSSDYGVVSSLARSYIEGMKEAGMHSCIKHFPGHGTVEEDSHFALPVDKRDFDAVWSSDLKPFRDLVEIASSVMVAHILFPEIDELPAGFSKVWMQDVLKERLAFQGVVFSDDLSMGGAAAYGSYEDRAVLALDAGCDAILVCNNPAAAISVIENLERQGFVGTGKISCMRQSCRKGYSFSRARLSRAKYLVEQLLS